MAIKGADGLTAEQMLDEVQRGARFVTFPYCMSAIVITLRRSSDIHFIRQGENSVVKGLPYLCISLFLGWWGIPWGLIWTPTYIVNNLCGGKNITDKVIPTLQAQLTAQPTYSMPGQWPPRPNVSQ